VGGFILSPVVRYTSGRYGDILQTEKIGGAAVFDVDFTYAAAMPQIKAGSLDITLAFSNVLNSKYVSILNTSDYTTLGSTYQMGAPFTVQGAISLSF
jgi:iron complex outermembrane receptor protein